MSTLHHRWGGVAFHRSSFSSNAHRGGFSLNLHISGSFIKNVGIDSFFWWMSHLVWKILFDEKLPSIHQNYTFVHSMNEPLVLSFDEKPLWWKAALMNSCFDEKLLHPWMGRRFQVWIRVYLRRQDVLDVEVLPVSPRLPVNRHRVLPLVPHLGVDVLQKFHLRYSIPAKFATVVLSCKSFQLCLRAFP